MSMDFNLFVATQKMELDKQQKEFEKYRARREQAQQSKARDSVVRSCERVEHHKQKLVHYLQMRLKIARPVIQSDLDERDRIQGSYPSLIRQYVSNEKPLFFHGVKELTSLETILASGHLGFLPDEDILSSVPPGLDVTTADCLETTIDGFVGLGHSGFSRFLPAGCLFVIRPQNDEEREYAIEKTGKTTELHLEAVNFKTEPDRLVAIVSTTENQKRISELAQKYGLDPSKVYTFDGFIEHLSKQNPSKLLTFLKESSKPQNPSLVRQRVDEPRS